MTQAEIRPIAPPMTAPRVVILPQNIDISRTGKLVEAAMAKARPTMKATFWFSKAMPSTMETMPMMTVVIFDTRISSASLARPRAKTEA